MPLMPSLFPLLLGPFLGVIFIFCSCNAQGTSQSLFPSPSTIPSASPLANSTLSLRNITSSTSQKDVQKFTTVFLGETLVFDYVIYSSMRSIYINTNSFLWSSVDSILNGGGHNSRSFENLFTTVLASMGTLLIVLTATFLFV